MLLWVLLFILGMGLLFAEIFIPSGGILGLLAVGSATFAIIQIWQESSGIALFLMAFSVAYVVWLIRFGMKRVSLTQVLEQKDTLGSDQTLDQLGNQIGEALTILRPSGMAMFGSKKVTVMTRGEFIAKGVRVRVVDTSGNRVVVRADLESENSSEASTGGKE